MALYGNTSSGRRLPEYRVAALATADLERFLSELPISLDRTGHIEWMVTEDDEGNYVTHGAIKIPVNMIFAPAEEEGKDPVLQRIVINGKRKYDARVTEEEVHDENFGIDLDKAQIDSFIRFRKSIKS